MAVHIIIDEARAHYLHLGVSTHASHPIAALLTLAALLARGVISDCIAIVNGCTRAAI